MLWYFNGRVVRTPWLWVLRVRFSNGLNMGLALGTAGSIPNGMKVGLDLGTAGSIPNGLKKCLWVIFAVFIHINIQERPKSSQTSLLYQTFQHKPLCHHR